MLLAFKKTITWHWQSLYEVEAPCEVNEGAADAEFGSMTFDELWTLGQYLTNIYFFLYFVKNFDSFPKC